jgi:hypothetical protein
VGPPIRKEQEFPRVIILDKFRNLFTNNSKSSSSLSSSDADDDGSALLHYLLIERKENDGE